MPRVAKDKAKRTKKKLNKTEQENTKTNTKDDKFSFDEEIVIGLKRIDEPKIVDKKVKKAKKKSKATNSKKKVKNNSNNKNKDKDKKYVDDDSGIIIKSKYMSNYEEKE